MAVIVFGSLLLLTMIFSIIGTYTNPSRRPHNEIDFRKFAQARLAAEAKPSTPSSDEASRDEQTDRERLESQAMQEVRSTRSRRL